LRSRRGSDFVAGGLFREGGSAHRLDRQASHLRQVKPKFVADLQAGLNATLSSDQANVIGLFWSVLKSNIPSKPNGNENFIIPTATTLREAKIISNRNA
jgi:hypothetical protein